MYTIRQSSKQSITSEKLAATIIPYPFEWDIRSKCTPGSDPSTCSIPTIYAVKNSLGQALCVFRVGGLRRREPGTI